jgi:hypothetical protein
VIDLDVLGPLDQNAVDDSRADVVKPISLINHMNEKVLKNISLGVCPISRPNIDSPKSISYPPPLHEAQASLEPKPYRGGSLRVYEGSSILARGIETKEKKQCCWKLMKKFHRMAIGADVVIKDVSDLLGKEKVDEN